MNNIFVKDAIETKASIEVDSTQYEVLKINVNAMKEIITSNYHIKEKYSEYNKLKQNYITYELKKHQLELIESKINNNIESIKNNIISTEEKIKKYESNKISIEKNRTIQCQIDENMILLSKEELLFESIGHEILTIYGKMEVEKSNKHLFIDNINKLKNYNIKLEHYKRYINCIKRDGIPYTLIQKIIPVIENEINNILSQIVEFSIVINLDDSKNINMFIVYDENNYWPLELAGGMEKFISSIAIRVALTNISNLPRPNFLIIDEGWGTLDRENLGSVSMLMDYLKTQFDFVLIISHVDQIKDVADVLIDIKKEDNYSLIQHI